MNSLPTNEKPAAVSVILALRTVPTDAQPVRLAFG